MPVMCEQAAAPKARWAAQNVLAVAALPTATPCARLHARNLACEWGLSHLAATIELVVSELVTNAVQASVDHDGRPRSSADTGLACIRLRLSTDGVAALAEVWDENFQLPHQLGLVSMMRAAAASCWSMPWPSAGVGTCPLRAEARSCGHCWAANSKQIHGVTLGHHGPESVVGDTIG